MLADHHGTIFPGKVIFHAYPYDTPQISRCCLAIIHCLPHGYVQKFHFDSAFIHASEDLSNRSFDHVFYCIIRRSALRPHVQLDLDS